MHRPGDLGREEGGVNISSARSADDLFVAGDEAEDAGLLQEAREFFETGASLGDENCMLRLGLLHDLGIGVPINQPLALRWYLRAWRRGSEIAATYIATVYRDAGREERAAQWYHLGAEQDDGDAAVELGERYLVGRGVEKSLGEARIWLTSAARSDNITEAGRERAIELLEDLKPTLASP